MLLHPLNRSNFARAFGSAILVSAATLASCGGEAPEATPATGSSDAATEASAPAPAQPAAATAVAPTNTPAAETAVADGPIQVVESLDSTVHSGAKPTNLELPAADPVLGEPLVINGEVVSFADVRRQILFGEPGRVALEMKKLEVIMNQEIARRVEGGASIDDFRVSQEEVANAIAEQEEKIKEEFPDQEVELSEVIPIGADGLPDRVMLTKVFMKVFLPENPADYPAITLDAFNASEQGEVLVQALQREWDAKEAGEDVDTNPMFFQMVFQELRDHLLGTSEILQGAELGEDVLMRINGTDIRVSDLWPQVERNVSISDVRSAKQWIVNMRLLEKELGDLWLTDVAAEEQYAAHSDPYKDSMFNVETIALMVKKYPSLDAYREFRHAYDSFRGKIGSELTPDRLKAFAQERTMQLLGQAQVDVDVILISAYDFETKRWKENGWAWAAERAQEVVRELVESGRSFDDVLEEYSEFYDPPVPASFAGQWNPKSKGRFRAQTRNQLMQMMEESECWQFLNGQTITDYIFFEQEPGSVAAPMRGPHGWYIPRLLKRNAAPEMVNLTQENIIVMAEQDYTLVKMAAYVQEIIEKNEVYGLQ